MTTDSIFHPTNRLFLNHSDLWKAFEPIFQDPNDQFKKIEKKIESIVEQFEDSINFEFKRAFLSKLEKRQFTKMFATITTAEIVSTPFFQGMKSRQPTPYHLALIEIVEDTQQVQNLPKRDRSAVANWYVGVLEASVSPKHLKELVDREELAWKQTNELEDYQLGIKKCTRKQYAQLLQELSKTSDVKLVISVDERTPTEEILKISGSTHLQHISKLSDLK